MGDWVLELDVFDGGWVLGTLAEAGKGVYGVGGAHLGWMVVDGESGWWGLDR